MFKVGDTGETRGGNRYTVVRVGVDASYYGRRQPIQAEVEDEGTQFYFADGRFMGGEGPLDLLPPLRPDRAPAPANCPIIALLLAAGHVTEEQVEAAKRLAELAR